MTEKKITFKTLGCRLNQFETDALASQFQKNGYRVVDFNKKSDAVVINTCTVTDQSDQKSGQLIRQAVRKHQDAMVIVTGCMVNNHRKELERNTGSQILFVDNDHKSSIFSMIDAHFNGEVIHPDHFNPNLFDYEAAEKTFHTRSWIKIQDGCDNFCTFCIIPKVRGRATSRPVADILENIKQVIDFGFKEIVLTGVNIGRYHHEGVDFEGLTERMLNLSGNFRLRIGSIEPEGFGDRLFNLFDHPKLTPHLHLCLQSGSDKILMKMRRFYTVASFLDIVEKLRSRNPHFNLTTDVIVGFPGESEDDFLKTAELCRKVGFGHIHTFKYSVRKGTRAERMPDQIPEAVKIERSEKIRQIGEAKKRYYRSSLIGKTQTVLVEKIITGIAHGYGESYVPVKFPATNAKENTFVKVKLTTLETGEDPALIGDAL